MFRVLYWKTISSDKITLERRSMPSFVVRHLLLHNMSRYMHAVSTLQLKPRNKQTNTHTHTPTLNNVHTHRGIYKTCARTYRHQYSPAVLPSLFHPSIPPSTHPSHSFMHSCKHVCIQSCIHSCAFVFNDSCVLRYIDISIRLASSKKDDKFIASGSP